MEIVRREITEYLYDATGIRVSSTQETDADGDGSGTSTVTTTTYLSDPQNPTGYAQTLEEVTKDGTGVVTKRVVYTIGHDQISQTVYDAANPTVTTHTFGADGHGSTRVLTDAVAAIAQAAGVQQIYQYDAHGNALGFDPATALTSYLYSGESFDARIGQTYLRARWYDATTGRFNRLDPFFGNVNDPQSLHKYLYVHGDPVNGVDPTGLFSLGGMLVGAAMGANLRSIGANAYGDVHGTINDSIQGLSAGHDLETATWSAWLGNYGFQIGFGISFGTIAGVLGHKQIFERLASAYSRVFRNGDQVVGFVKVGRGIVIPPGPMMPRILKGPYRGRIIPGVTGVVTGSDSTRIQLRKRMIHRMGLTKNRSALRALADYEAHHLLPLELKDHPTLQRIGVALNDPSNGILLPGHVHFGSHARYTAAVSDALDKIHANLKHEEQMEQLWAIQMKIVDALSNRTAKLTGPDPTTYDKWRRILDL